MWRKREMSLEEMDLDLLCVNTIRTLSIDCITRAKSGHPGAPLGCAAMVYALWTRFLRHSPSDPSWPDRDRFVLSAGHASALLYSLLHLTGYELSLEDLMQFRQWESKTPGHPEADCAPGVEVTTGPLGQGLGNAVGMAMAERYLAAYFNRDGYDIADHHTYVLCSDGDLMEGISHEACSLAGHLQLGKLIVLYDDNGISLDGPTSGWFTEDTEARFNAYHWQVIRVRDGNDVDAVSAAIEDAKAEPHRPSLIICRTHIGYGSPLQDSHQAHGKPLDEDQLRETKRNLGWPQEEKFYVPARALDHFRKAVDEGRRRQAEWRRTFQDYARQYPQLAQEWQQAWRGERPAGWDSQLPTWDLEDGPVATRDAAGKALEAIRKNYPMLLGGDADLGSSTKTLPGDKRDIGPEDFSARNIRFGVREHAMAAICSGMARHGAIRPFGSTFLVFSDYARPSLRMAAMMRVPVIYQFTHDSIGVGEDGPTHEPVEHVASLRAIPNWTVIRPGDANEAAEAWRVAIENTDGPTAIICSRQKLPILDRTRCAPAEGVRRGAYVLLDAEGQRPDVVLMASGSELCKVVEARERLAQEGVKARVVSFPSWELFQKQPERYRQEVLPPEMRTRLAVEAGSPMGWHRWVGPEGDVIGVETFGASASCEVNMENFGFGVENIVRRALELLGKPGSRNP